MRRWFSCGVVVLALAGAALAATESTAELKSRCDASSGGDQARFCLEYARRELAEADNLFNQGEVEKGQAAVREVVESAHKGANAAATSGKHVKETEIDLRKLAKRMHEMGETLSIDDRDPVRKAVDELEQIRSDLMVRMWGPQTQPKGKS